jgi:hypothetical protein
MSNLVSTPVHAGIRKPKGRRVNPIRSFDWVCPTVSQVTSMVQQSVISTADQPPVRDRIKAYRATVTGGVVMDRYRLKASIPAIHDTGEGGEVRVTLPPGAMLIESALHATTLMGMMGVQWEGRYYSVHPRDLFKKAEQISTA